MNTFIKLVLLTSLWLISPTIGLCQEQAVLCDESSEVSIRNQVEMAVKGLASRNTAPLIEGFGGRKRAAFPKSFIWKEQSRVRDCILLLTKYPHVSCDMLINQLKDDGYSITLNGNAGAQNVAVGAICRLIIVETLTRPCVNAAPKVERVQRRLAKPDVIDFVKLDEWYERQRKNRSLQDMQMMVLQWAVSDIEGIGRISDNERAAAIGHLKGRMADIIRSAAPLPLDRFFHDSRGVYLEAPEDAVEPNDM